MLYLGFISTMGIFTKGCIFQEFFSIFWMLKYDKADK